MSTNPVVTPTAEQQALLSQTATLFESVVQGFGVDPVTTRNEDKQNSWTLQRGSAKIWVDVFFSPNNNDCYMSILGYVCQLPNANREAFFEELLRLNYDLFGCAFTIYDRFVYVQNLREIGGLSADEIRASMNRVGFYSDQYDDMFIAKYGVTK